MNDISAKRAIARRLPEVGRLCLAALVAVLPGCGRHSGEAMPPATEEVWHFSVEGMSCEGCVGTVTAAIQPLPGVQAVDVSLKDKRATVRVDAAQASPQAVVAAVEKAGYKAKQIR